jgi:hypothetical protein
MDTKRSWPARLLIGLVLLWNVQCALAFLGRTEVYVAGFELAGISGETMVRGVGLLFLMWNVPYLLAAWRPRRYRVSLIETICMQTLGLVGETVLLLFLPQGHAPLRATATRFILFDGVGLVLLVAAAGLSAEPPRRPRAGRTDAGL